MDEALFLFPCTSMMNVAFTMRKEEFLMSVGESVMVALFVITVVFVVLVSLYVVIKLFSLLIRAVEKAVAKPAA